MQCPLPKMIFRDCQSSGIRTMDLTPDRIREMTIIPPARNNMPVYMRNHVSKTGQVDFLWRNKASHNPLNRKDNTHQPRLRCVWKIGHFSHVGGPDYTAKARVMGIIDAYDPVGR